MSAPPSEAQGLVPISEISSQIKMTALSRALLIVAGLLILAIGGFLVMLAVRDIPAPSARIEKVIPNDRFTR